MNGAKRKPSLKGPRASKPARDALAGIPAAGLTRLARAGGVKTLSGLVPEESRGVMTVFVEDVVKVASTLTQYGRRKTVSAEDVKAALERTGRKIYSTLQESSLKTCKPLTGNGIKQIKQAQKSSGDCLQIPRASFERLVRKVGGSFIESQRWTPEALAVLQVATEAYMTQLYEHAMVAAIHGKRTTLMPKDLQLVRRIRGEN